MFRRPADAAAPDSAARSRPLMTPTIDEVLNRIPIWTGVAGLTVTPLPGGITNTNYRVDVAGEAFVVRVGTPGAEVLGIDREREYRCLIAAGAAGAAPEVVYCRPAEGVLVTRFVPGRALASGETLPPEGVARVVQTMHRYHNGPAFPGSFSPFRTLDEYRSAARRGSAPLPLDIDSLYSALARLEEALQPGETTIRPCHNDLWGPNLIDDGQRVVIVDWEYAGMGDLYFDLANFAIYHCPSDAADTALLRAYFGTVGHGPPARLKLQRAVAELREAMWYVVARQIAPHRRDFTAHARAHFDRCRAALGDSRLATWLTAASTDV